ncbi:MAG: Extracellular solute-binding protein [Candidatus Magasanikbacteria bacterium GW2011_GWC2_34_16]|uniref:Extracellular solute-binding protein n=2 Tax=Candidatus Magasanikiibacteriota TaxID=1752731 RepID=A0A0G0HG98_9BACT|nr:MAG: Extracellular solute-binding protein [Candidatus Magasanikbacteria bacterium GW2011_GWC2_34_16]KKQ41222.1 MAG: Extracellular solute-binding protein [Candidatus Magasanikbacteria bacterium GW2011_GWA2_37_8]
MNWNISSLISKLKRNKKSGNNLDQKLIQKIRPRSLPTWTQFKYLTNFLNPKEMRVFVSAIILVVATILSWGTIFVIQHSGTVPKLGGEYSEALIGQPKYINPLFASINDVDADISELIFSGLFRYGPDQKLIPDLAENYTVGNDNKTYDITLKQNISWSDGNPFTAGDVVYTFETIQNPEVGSPLLSAWQGVKVEKIDEFTVRFTLKQPFAPFLEALTTGILPEHVWSNINPSSIKLARYNLQPVGTGVWQFSKMVKDESGYIQTYTLTQNKHSAVKPYLNTIVFKFFNSYVEAASAIRSQNSLAISFFPYNLKEKIIGKNIIAYPIYLPQYTALFFNQTNQPNLKNADVRLALAKSINKNQLIQEVFAGDAKAIQSPILAGNLGYNPDLKTIPLDLEAATKLLDKTWVRIQPEEYFKIRRDTLIKTYQARIDAVTENSSSTPEIVSSTLENIEKEINQTIRQEMSSEQNFYRRDTKNNLLQLTITTADTPEYIKTAELIATMWRSLGVPTAIQTINSQQITKEIIKTRNYQILLYGEMAGGDPDPFPFWHSSQIDYPGLNLAMFSNRDADKILEDARGTTNEAERGKLYQKFQDILVTEVPAIFLYTPTHIMAINKEIKGVNINHIINPADRYRQINEWYIKTGWRWK